VPDRSRPEVNRPNTNLLLKNASATFVRAERTDLQPIHNYLLCDFVVMLTVSFVYPSKVVHGRQLAVPKLCKSLQHMCNCNNWNCVFQAKMYNAKYRDLEANEVSFVVEGAIFGIADADLPIHYSTFMGLR